MRKDGRRVLTVCTNSKNERSSIENIINLMSGVNLYKKQSIKDVKLN